MKTIGFFCAQTLIKDQDLKYQIASFQLNHICLIVSVEQQILKQQRDVITGFVTDVTGEKRGPSKHYRRFDVLTSSNERIFGWVFSTMEIDQTYAGDVLL